MSQSAVDRVVLLGDNDTTAHRAELARDAAKQHCIIVEAFGFEEGEAGGTDDLTEIDAVVAALGRAIAGRMDVWVPFPGPDFIREQHLRRLSLVLQRHGLNVRLTRGLYPAPTDGGMNEIDFALRREVQAVDSLDQAALAAEGAKSLGREIEMALVKADGRQSVRRTTDGGRANVHPVPPMLPSPAVPWPERKRQVKRYAGWLVHGCGVTQAATARVLNSAGQRTPTGREWKPGTVSKLLAGKYDDPRRPGDFRPDAVAG
ncbi:hypothetical protein [Mycolicibacter kumamotonensis]|jgi:hypothetical protein|uniref:Recombinase family protein n=1 Tax=Mycolicibacter kumamotonensis TaxID=354243 RepID=A0A1B8SGK1_9MYCO|nr:hypothetical protein [Mycolicibacter kumamotonensis]NDJ90864.1 hypothetical protein [Mycolicibacter kumamotonensis]OBY31860.1 hypothetical protein ACT18_10130 [Mycolicibacter kumamotonensis]ORA78687.1 hypothetical protein BST28_13965 [Mycolicibacter kumamotonensis]